MTQLLNIVLFLRIIFFPKLYQSQQFPSNVSHLKLFPQFTMIMVIYKDASVSLKVNVIIRWLYVHSILSSWMNTQFINHKRNSHTKFDMLPCYCSIQQTQNDLDEHSENSVCVRHKLHSPQRIHMANDHSSNENRHSFICDLCREQIHKDSLSANVETKQLIFCIIKSAVS